MPFESESSYTDNNAEEEDDEDDDSEKIADNGDGDCEAIQETMDNEGGGEGNCKEDESSDEGSVGHKSETSSHRKKRRLSTAKEDDNGAELTRPGHAASATVRSVGRNAGVVETNPLPNLRTARRACPL